MLLTACIEAGRSTLTHTSWTGLTLGSRKWMSGRVPHSFAFFANEWGYGDARSRAVHSSQKPSREAR